MFNVKDLKNAEIPNVVVEASNNIFKELGNNTYNFLDLISEFIDNSIAAKKEGILSVDIEVGIAEDEAESYFLIRDNASGIKRENLGKAISPGELSGGASLNEHGLGFKQAVSALGEFEYLATKTIEDSEAIVVDELRYGEIFPKLINVDWNNGTEICVKKLKGIVPLNPQTYTKSISTYLGSRYRRFLKSANPLMKLTIKLLDLEDVNDKDNPAVISEWNVTELKPVYFHPNERRNSPVISKKSFKGIGWDAELTFGYAPKDDEYEEMGLPVPKKFEPYHVSLPKQGFDLIRNDRVIKFSQLSEIELVPTRHNRFNNIRGEIDLKKGFVTAITKNSVIMDKHFKELISDLREFLEEGEYLNKKTYPDELPEKLVRDRLAAHMTSRAIDKKTDVKKEYAVEGLGGFIDILADGEAWELKAHDASGLDIYQLFAYLDMGNIGSGYLVAPKFKTGAAAAADFIFKNHNKKITLVESSELPIIHPASLEELKKYY